MQNQDIDINSVEEIVIVVPEDAMQDGELRDLLIDLLGDDVPEEEIQKILKAASDESLSEEDFDKLVDDFILKNF